MNGGSTPILRSLRWISQMLVRRNDADREGTEQGKIHNLGRGCSALFIGKMKDVDIGSLPSNHLRLDFLMRPIDNRAPPLLTKAHNFNSHCMKTYETKITPGSTGFLKDAFALQSLDSFLRPFIAPSQRHFGIDSLWTIKLLCRRSNLSTNDVDS